ncbi:MAG: zf-HC2 domain-containing protein [Bacteroidales bacterium]|nr:zf-HC2 domain-containing protein [Bacteroidales bacterium]
MNCDVAHILMLCRRPSGPGDLTPEDAHLLDQHLAECPECSRILESTLAFDRSAAQVMRNVPVPTAGKQQLLTQITTRQARAFRRTWYFRATMTVLAGVTVLMGYGVIRAARPQFEPDSLAWQKDQERQDPAWAVREWLTQEGFSPDLPADFNLQLCTAFGRFPVQGRSVPGLEFRYLDPQTGREEIAWLYLLADARFQFPNLDPARSSYFTSQILHDDRKQSGIVYVVLYTTPTLQPFLRRFHQPLT